MAHQMVDGESEIGDPSKKKLGTETQVEVQPEMLRRMRNEADVGLFMAFGLGLWFFIFSVGFHFFFSFIFTFCLRFIGSRGLSFVKMHLWSYFVVVPPRLPFQPKSVCRAVFFIFIFFIIVCAEDEGKFHKASPVCLACLPWLILPLFLIALSI